MIASLLFTLFFALCGIVCGSVVFRSQSFLKRIWLGLVLGLFGMIWLPSLFAFLLGFTLLAQLLGAGLMGLIALVFAIKGRLRFPFSKAESKRLSYLILLLPILLVGGKLFSTHILYPENGGYSVGQTTYGDLAMHLGFITSIAAQGTFPPDYSIFPGHTINYPFLCETASSSLLLLGCPLRWAYLIPALYAFVLVILGVYFFFLQWLKRPGRSVFATFLFFVGGGFGFAYFFDRVNGSSTIASLIGDSGLSSNLSFLLDGFYDTPTNLPAIGLRWVNPIVDMLIPQRATLFGWAFLFPCLYLLTGFTFRKQKENVLPLAVLAGGLPLIHTHSFLALGVISAVYCISDLIRSFDKKRLLQWVLYGGIAVLLAAPQLFGFTFRQASESGMVRLHFNWANEVDSYLWFYLKNLGWLFVLFPFSLLLLSKEDRRIASGPIALWLLSECVVFQPNVYDNNKLLFIWFACLCGLTAKLLGYLLHKLNYSLRKKALPFEEESALQKTAFFAALVCFIYLLTGLLGSEGDGLTAKMSGVFTELFLLLFLVYMETRLLLRGVKKKETAGILFSAVPLFIACYVSVFLLKNAFAESSAATLSFTGMQTVALLLYAFLALAAASLPLFFRRFNLKLSGVGLRYIGRELCVFLLAFTLFISGIMTIVREWRSSYTVFTSDEIAAADYITENTESDALFLTDYSWHLNTVSVLTGRSIVCGPDLYLYFHGIDTAERHADVTAMLEDPGDNLALYEAYGVDYVYIGSSEYANYDCDLTYFSENFTLVYNSNGIRIYKVK